jgi:hypothetical protein
VTVLHGREGVSLHDIEWSVDELRRQLQLMLLWNGLSPLDLMRAYDKGRDGKAANGEFSQKEFVRT